jgi:predicted polyphosphate/ATP-dependent NAD kinase
VSHAFAVSNHQKVNILERALVVMCASGVERVEIMPDPFGIGLRALENLRGDSAVQRAVRVIDMVWEGMPGDTLVAAEYLRREGARCVLVLGGDGTCRLVGKGCGEVPLLPVSSGTNNVVPRFVEGTIAGMAAAFVSHYPEVPLSHFAYRHKRLVLLRGLAEVDEALVDIAIVAGQFAGAKAIWEPESLRQVFVSRAQPFHIGLSAIIGLHWPVHPEEPRGAVVAIRPGFPQVAAPIAPGVLANVPTGPVEELAPGAPHPIYTEESCIAALDGEREIPLRRGEDAAVVLRLDGPWIVDVERTMLVAAGHGSEHKS